MESDQQSETSRVKVRRWSQSLTIKEQRLISKLNILLWRSAATQGDTDCREDSLYTLTTEPAGLSPISMLQTNIIIFIMCCFCSEYSTNWCSFLFCTNRKSNRLPLPVKFNKEKTKCFFFLIFLKSLKLFFTLITNLQASYRRLDLVCTGCWCLWVDRKFCVTLCNFSTMK